MDNTHSVIIYRSRSEQMWDELLFGDKAILPPEVALWFWYAVFAIVGMFVLRFLYEAFLATTVKNQRSRIKVKRSLPLKRIDAEELNNQLARSRIRGRLSGFWRR